MTWRSRFKYREDDLVVGSYLLIHGVQEEDYGEYQCSISNTWFQVLEVQVRLLRAVEFLEEPMQQRLYKQDFLLLSAVLLFLVALFALYLRFGLQLRVIWKDACGYKETNDGKEYDVLVCYNDADCDFVLGVIVPTLETRYNYRCCSHHVSPNSLGKTWPAELNSLAQRSRRLLAVLSPSMLAGNWTSADLYYALYTLLRIHSKVVCISLKLANAPVVFSQTTEDGEIEVRISKLPLCDSEKTPHNESLAVLLQAAPVVEWYSNVGRDERARFWGALRLRLPPRHPFQGSESSDSLDQITVSGSTKKRTLLTNSHESLEVLV
uniref:Single Ig IL-1-related receptor n=1 Tax=Timema genevievae TaxID=629358 RepID=A0A7R9K752_TIMGE|nr:unnamed protein product [Timema genevievae]